MAGPIPTYLTTQQAAQTAFTVPFGLLAFVNSAIATATAAGEFNVTVDCSLFVTEDISNLRIYLDSLGYNVEFAKNTSDKSLNIDWGKFLDDATDATIVYQGTTPWIIAGTVDQGAPGATPWPVSISSFPGSLTVDQGTSPWIVAGTVAATQSGVWTTGRTWTLAGGTDSVSAVQSGVWTVEQGTPPWSVSVTNFPATQPVSGTVTALQGTSPWVVSGAVTTSPDVNIHDSAGNALTSTVGSLNANITNFPATTAVTQSTSPWVVSGTVTSNQGTSPWVVSGTVAATQSGAWTTGRTWALSSGTDSVTVTGTVAATQSTSPWVVSGTVTSNQGTSPWVTNMTQVGGSSLTLGQKTSANSVPVVIASDQSSVPVIPGQVTNGFSACTTKTAIGTTELVALFVKNPSGSGKTLRLRKIVFGNIHTVDGSWVRLRVYSNPTTSADGTSVSINTLAIGSGNTSSATAFVTPTVSVNGSLLQDLVVYSGFSEVYDCDNRWSLAANNTILYTVVADATSRSSNMSLVWEEI